MFLALSALGLILVTICYAMRPDMATALTVFPVWVWPVPGLFLLRLAWFREAGQRYKFAIAIVCVSWFAYVVAFAEEVRSLRRSVLSSWRSSTHWEEMARQGRTLRVVSVNVGLDLAAAADVKQYAPDLVLLQESPSPAAAEKMADELFQGEAGVLVGVDASVLARGKVAPVPLPPDSGLYFTQARVQLTTGIEIGVISLHLATPPVRVDLWSPSAWTELRMHRGKQLAQMQTIARQIAHIPPNVPIIVGGDFNAPQGDAIFRLLEPRLRDAFRDGGVGWGNTHENDLPVLRIDEIWISDHFGAGQVRAHRTARSDHRFVVCDLWIEDYPKAPR